MQYSISLAYHTLDNTRSACSMCNAQQTHLSLGYVTRPQTNATCNPQNLRRTFRSTKRSTCSIRNVQQTHLESERSRQGTHFITDECTHRRQQQLIDICWNQALKNYKMITGNNTPICSKRATPRTFTTSMLLL